MSWYKLNKLYDRYFELNFVPDRKFKKLSLIESALHTIDHIVKNYPAPYNLAVSGGVDSQVVLYSWYLSKVPFNVITAIYNEDLNFHDISSLYDFARNFNIKVNSKKIDIINFLENELSNYALKYQCSSPQICSHMKICDSIDQGTIILSGNCLNEYAEDLDFVKLGIYRYAQLSGKQVVPYFLLETPEIAYSIYVPSINPITKKRYDRVEIYLNEGIPLIIPDSKFTGFEKIKEIFEQKNYDPMIKLKYFSKSGKNKFDNLFREPYKNILDNQRVVCKKILVKDIDQYYE